MYIFLEAALPPTIEYVFFFLLVQHRDAGKDKEKTSHMIRDRRERGANDGRSATDTNLDERPRTKPNKKNSRRQNHEVEAKKRELLSMKGCSRQGN